MDESKENVPTRTTRASARGRQDTATVALTKVIGGTNRHNGGSSQGDDATVDVDGARATRRTRKALDDASNGAVLVSAPNAMEDAPTEALTSGGTEAGVRAATRDLKSMRARLDAARKESEKSDDAQVVVPAPAAPVVVPAPEVAAAPVAPVISLQPTSSGVASLYREYYENEDFIDKCERAMNFRPKARPHDYKNRIEELTTAVKASKDCLRHVFQNGATFSKE